LQLFAEMSPERAIFCLPEKRRTRMIRNFPLVGGIGGAHCARCSLGDLILPTHCAIMDRLIYDFTRFMVVLISFFAHT
jgi:hypothetical protein